MSALLLSNAGTCSGDQLKASLPEPKAAPVSASPGAHRISSEFVEDATTLSPEEIEALDERLEVTLDCSPSLRRRWHGETDGLADTSRSGLDFSVTALLKAGGFAYREAAYLLVHRFKHGKGSENTERDLERNWTRCGTAAPNEIVAVCVEAKGSGDAWEPILYGVRPNAQTVDTVLDELSRDKRFSGKRALKADFDAYSATMTAKEAEQQVREQAGRRLALLWDATQLNEMVEQVEGALQTVRGKWEVLLYGGIHSRVAVKPPQHLHLIDDIGARAPRIPILEPYTQSGMLLRIEQSVSCYGQKDGRAVSIPIPDKLPALVLNKPDPDLPVTIGLVSHPLVLPNGELLITEGLHSGSGIYAHFGGASFEAPGAMSAEQGLAVLRAEMLGEFVFASEADEAAALALILTAVERKTLDTAPGFMVNASTQGSGKTTLVRMAHLLVTGHDMPVAAMSESVEEQDKALTAMLMASVPIVCFDNVPDAFTVRSPVLARALTSPTHTGRILGLSKMAELPTNTVFVVTGNNITADIDLSRRLLEVRLAPSEERPEQRQFQNPDVVGYVLSNRSRWMQAALAVLIGSREPMPDARPSGFQKWDRVVRWPLVGAGCADPVTKFDDVREQSPDHERQVAWMLGLVHGFGVGKPFRAKDLVVSMGMTHVVHSTSTHENNGAQIVMYSDYLIEHPPAKGWGNVRSIGWVLEGLVGRTVEGYTLTKKKVNGTTRYVVELR